jgi:hypothetical protein
MANLKPLIMNPAHRSSVNDPMGISRYAPPPKIPHDQNNRHSSKQGLHRVLKSLTTWAYLGIYKRDYGIIPRRYLLSQVRAHTIPLARTREL